MSLREVEMVMGGMWWDSYLHHQLSLQIPNPNMQEMDGRSLLDKLEVAAASHTHA